MKFSFGFFFLVFATVLAADAPPRTVIPRADGSQRPYLSRLWLNPGGNGCDILNYHLFDYTERYPDRVKYVGPDDIVTIEGFFDYLATKSPIIVKDDDGHVVSCLIFFNRAIFTPWGEEIVYLMDRKKDGYLRAFGERTSVSGYADPLAREGIQIRQGSRHYA